MKNLYYIFIAGLMIIGSCKKESTDAMAVVSPEKFTDSLAHPTASFTFVSPSGGGSSTIDTPFYYLPAVIRLTSQSVLVTSYEWYLRRQSLPDSLFSTAKNPTLNYYTTLSSASIVLIAKNGLSSTVLSKPFKIKNTPNGIKIKSIVIDTMPFINPSTSTFWNGVNGVNLFCQLIKTSTASIVMDTLNGPGWSSAPTATAGIYPVKTNLAATPYTIKYPTGIKSFTLSSAIPGVTMLDSFKFKLFNKNSSGSVDLIGDVDLIPANYFGGVLPTNNFCQQSIFEYLFKTYCTMALKNMLKIACLMLVSNAIFAQDTLSVAKDSLKNTSKTYCKDSLRNNFTMNVYAAVPLSDFKSTDYNNVNSGYAKTGYGADLMYSYRLWKGLGLGLNLSYTKNSINEKKLADQIKDITMNQTGFTTVYSSAAPAFWQTYSISGGLTYQFWIGSDKKFGLEPVVFFGESYVNTPQVVYNVRIDNLTFETRNNRKGSWAFMHREGINLNYLIGSRTIFHINTSYMSVSGSGKNLEHEVVGNTTYTSTLTNYNININTIYLGIGITTRF